MYSNQMFSHLGGAPQAGDMQTMPGDAGGLQALLARMQGQQPQTNMPTIDGTGVPQTNMPQAGVAGPVQSMPASAGAASGMPGPSGVQTMPTPGGVQTLPAPAPAPAQGMGIGGRPAHLTGIYTGNNWGTGPAPMAPNAPPGVPQQQPAAPQPRPIMPTLPPQQPPRPIMPTLPTPTPQPQPQPIQPMPQQVAPMPQRQNQQTSYSDEVGGMGRRFRAMGLGR
jgi:hypothetical protein